MGPFRTQGASILSAARKVSVFHLPNGAGARELSFGGCLLINRSREVGATAGAESFPPEPCEFVASGERGSCPQRPPAIISRLASHIERILRNNRELFGEVDVETTVSVIFGPIMHFVCNQYSHDQPGDPDRNLRLQQFRLVMFKVARALLRSRASNSKVSGDLTN